MCISFERFLCELVGQSRFDSVCQDSDIYDVLEMAYMERVEGRGFMGHIDDEVFLEIIKKVVDKVLVV